MLRQLFSRLRSRLPLRLQRLEDRTVPALFTVTNLNDSGAGSLRQAVLDANAAIGPDTILVAPSGLLALTSGSISITDNLTIVGNGSLTVSGSNASRVFDIDDAGLNRITVSLSRMTMSVGNAAGGFGGVIRVADEALFLADVFVFGGRAVRGGGIDVDSGGQLTIDRSTISGNSASSLSGGGIYLAYGAVGIVRDSVISGNASGFAGGGIRVGYGGTLRVERSQIHSNTTTFDGAGISMELTGDLTVIDSSIYANGTGGSGTGGGINAGAAAFTLVNSTVSGNSAGEAAGVYLTSFYGGGKRPGGPDGNGPPPAPAAAIISSTIVFNSAGGGGGVASDRPVSIANTIITGNANATTADLVDFGLPVFTARFSMVESKGTATINDQGGMIYGVAPLLSPLQNNGGPTLTHALQADSRGLNEGDPAFVGVAGDQRGLPRVAGPRVDIGAVECEFGFVRGVVFNDANNNGVQDAGEAGAGDVFVWLDANGNGSPDNEEVIGLTNPDGTYLLAALPASYQPLHALRAGQRQTTANPAVQSLIAGVTNPGINYGNQALPGLIAVAGAGAVSGPVADFRALLGGLNPNVAGTQNNGQGRREINWDGVPDGFSSPNALPANFFNANSPRGVVFSGQGTGFQVSADDQNPTGTAPLFGNFNTNYPGYFSTFSPQRLFTPVGTNVYDIDFFVPGGSARATVSAFGAVFVDADNPVESSLEFFDANGVSLGVFLVPQIDNTRVAARPDGGVPAAPGLSFLGVQFTDGRRAAKVRVTGGNLLIGANDNYLSQDVVVVDDFIYSEPVAIAPPPTPTSPTRLAAIGSGPGGNATVLVYDDTGRQVASFRAFDISFRGEVHVATADIDGDGVEDVIVGAGPGGGPHVQVYNGKKLLETGVGERIVNPLGSFFAFTPEFRGGVNVTSGDVDGDGRSDIIVGAGPGGGPHVIAYSGLTGVALSSFYAYDISFRGGVNVAGGDFNGDGKSDIATGAGAGGGPHVRVFDVANKATLADFFAYAPAFHGGVSVAAGDVLLNGRDDLITGAGPGGGPHVRVFDGATFAAARDFFAYNPAFTGGVRVGVAHGPDDTPYLFFGAGPGGGPHVRAVDRDLNQIATFYAFDENFNGGVFVG